MVIKQVWQLMEIQLDIFKIVKVRFQLNSQDRCMVYLLQSHQADKWQDIFLMEVTMLLWQMARKHCMYLVQVCLIIVLVEVLQLQLEIQVIATVFL